MARALFFELRYFLLSYLYVLGEDDVNIKIVVVDRLVGTFLGVGNRKFGKFFGRNSGLNLVVKYRIILRYIIPKFFPISTKFNLPIC